MIRVFGMICVLLMAGCSSFVAIEPNKPAVVGDITLLPANGWTQLPSDLALGSNGVVWTVDGVFLNHLIIASVEHQKSLFKSQNDELPMPKFDQSMLPNEVENWVLTSFKNLYGGSVRIDSSGLAPMPMGSQDGISFSMRFYNLDGLLHNAKVFAVTEQKKIYLLVYVAPEVHYFQEYLPRVEALAGTLQLKLAP